MTGAGKTTVGKILAERLNYEFSDLDLIITEKTGHTPSEIFSLYGEETFRKIETQKLEDIFSNPPDKLILSCGGGIAVKEENRAALKKNSFVIWLFRPPGEILKDKEVLARPPIFGDFANYIKHFKEREPQYAATCDLKIACTEISPAVENIIIAIKKGANFHQNDNDK